MTSIWVYFLVQLVPSLLASFHKKYSIQKLSRYPESALYARQGSRSRKNVAKPEKGDTSPSSMKRPAAEHGSKTQEN